MDEKSRDDGPIKDSIESQFVEQEKTSWSAALGTEEFSLQEAIGGVRGVIEALLPGLVFVIAYILTQSLWWPVGLSAGVSVIFCLVRILQKTPLTQALAGLFGVIIGVIWAATSGKAENYYAWGLLTNGVYALLLFLSALIRQPLAGWAVKFLWQLPTTWMKDKQFPLLYKRCVLITWAWSFVFFLRLLVQAPLYFSEQVAALGIAKLVMGLPLFALAAWFTWVMLRNQNPLEAK